jgi:hypothetical protein
MLTVVAYSMHSELATAATVDTTIVFTMLKRGKIMLLAQKGISKLLVVLLIRHRHNNLL